MSSKTSIPEDNTIMPRVYKLTKLRQTFKKAKFKKQSSKTNPSPQYFPDDSDTNVVFAQCFRWHWKRNEKPHSNIIFNLATYGILTPLMFIVGKTKIRQFSINYMKMKILWIKEKCEHIFIWLKIDIWKQNMNNRYFFAYFLLFGK